MEMRAHAAPRQLVFCRKYDISMLDAKLRKSALHLRIKLLEVLALVLRRFRIGKTHK